MCQWCRRVAQRIGQDDFMKDFVEFFGVSKCVTISISRLSVVMKLRFLDLVMS